MGLKGKWGRCSMQVCLCAGKVTQVYIKTDPVLTKVCCKCRNFTFYSIFWVEYRFELILEALFKDPDDSIFGLRIRVL